MAKKKDQLEQKVLDLENQLKRAVADYRNLEARVSEGRSELTNFVGAELIKKMVPSLNNIHKAISGVQMEAANKHQELPSWFHGVRISMLELWKVLGEEGLSQIAPIVGSEFDPSTQEAIDVREGEDNKILELVEMGYNLNGKLLQPAKVVVGRSASVETSADKEGEN